MTLYLLAMAVTLVTLTGCQSRHKPDLSLFPECMTGPEAYTWVYWKNDHEPLIRVGRSRRDVYDPEADMLPGYSTAPECMHTDVDGDGDVDLKDVYERLNK